ncbi:MAG: hybrid sensor histidine kinase/response regulator, partial [Chloroflexota bacterium]
MSQSTVEPPSARLQNIASRADLSKDEKLHAILEMGLTAFHMENAIISQIDRSQQTYTVKYAVSPDNVIPPGTVFQLGTTYCNMTIDLPLPVTIPHVAVSEHMRHPCYLQFKLESYIGHRLMVHGQHYGTVNF